MANIKETPQYEIYLKALKALEQEGYELDRKNKWQSIVRRGSEEIGLIFVVKEPFDPENYGCGCLISLIPGVNDIINMINDWSNYETMIGVVKRINNSRKRGKAYWPKGSLVGGYTTDNWGFKYDENMIKILEAVELVV